jgi:type III secretion protein C
VHRTEVVTDMVAPMTSSSIERANSRRNLLRSESLRRVLSLALILSVSGAAAAMNMAAELGEFDTVKTAPSRGKKRNSQETKDIKKETERKSGRWMSARFVYEAAGRPLPEVLRDFGGAQGIPVVVSDGVEGKVQGSFDAEPEKFLDAISKSFGLIWYYDGAGLYIYPSRQMQNRMFRIQGYTAKKVHDLQRKLQVLDTRYPIRYSAADGTLLVSGPPRHIELISQLVESLDISSDQHLRKAVELVELKHASAADRMIGGKNIPGVVSILRKMFSNPDPLPKEINEELFSNHAPTVAATKIADMQRKASLADVLGGKTMGQADMAALGGKSTFNSRSLAAPLDKPDTPVFQAAPVGNAVVVVADALRMPNYVAAIRKMDTEPLLVELDVMIIDVNADHINELGLSWAVGLTNQKGQQGVQAPITPAANQESAPIMRMAFTGPGGYFNASLRALSTQGEAKLVSQSKVVAVAGQVATLGETRRAMIRVAGFQDAKLYPIESGTKIQVTPQVNRNKDTYQIRMMMDIEDGGFEPNSVDGVPIARQTRITTESQVVDGESVLLAGLSSDKSASTRTTIPGLSGLPLIGALFTSTEKTGRRNERLFLITPRIIKSIDSASVPVR